MAEPVVRVIKANPFNHRIVDINKKYLRVAAYARVSTDKDEQEDSFERQVDYYTRFIQSNPDWKLVKVFSDPGISGTRADKRPGFQEMLDECRKGNIDKILVKSIARFARNTVDALNYIRELKELGIGIYFEAQNIDTSTPGGDILLTILAATAEEESRTISKNVRWSYTKKFEKGDFTINYTNFLGYTRDKDRNFVIVPEEAEIVRRIYREFLYGYSITYIAKELTKEGVPTATKGHVWHTSVVRSILTNEKYYGSALMGKTFKPDVLSKKRQKNEGQVESYFVENAFEGIVTKEQFEMVRYEMKRRDEVHGYVGRVNGKFVSKYPFSRTIICGCCGNFYQRSDNMRQDGKKIPSWWCLNRRGSANACSQKGISEASLKRAFVKCLNELVGDIDDIKNILKVSISEILTDSPKDKIEELDSRIDELQNQMMELHKKKTNDEIDSTEYGKQGGKLSQMIDEQRKKKEDINTAYASSTLASRRIEEINETLDSIEPTEEFDENIFRRLVDTITINDRTKVTFKFKVGIERTIIADIK